MTTTIIIWIIIWGLICLIVVLAQTITKEKKDHLATLIELAEIKQCKKEVKCKLTKTEHALEALENRKLALDTEISVLKKRNVRIDERHTKCILENKKLKEKVVEEIENQNEISKHVPKNKQVVQKIWKPKNK